MINVHSIPFLGAHPDSFRRCEPGRKIDVIVIHSMEAPEKGDTAESTARFFASAPIGFGGTRARTSAHYCIDQDTVVQCVQCRDVAFAAPGCNHNGIQLEHAGYARQTRAEWLDDNSRSILKNSAALAGGVLVDKYKIPMLWLTVEDLIAGKRGFTSHLNVSKAFHKSTHSDPGLAFPIDQYMRWVRMANEGSL